ncbi:hypothetical protein [Maricaulis sp.]|uniref:hypothetical protein n=1 Tax=Maricaulis sp. TaxID=1486257 RepID=UPI003A8E23FB
MFDTGSMTDFLLRMFGLYYLAAGIGLFTAPDAFQTIAGELKSSALMRLISGILALTFGMIVLALNNDWTSWQAGIVTAIGWAGLIKGVTILALPTPFLGLTVALFARTEILRIMALIVTAAGAALLWLGFA